MVIERTVEKMRGCVRGIVEDIVPSGRPPERWRQASPLYADSGLASLFLPSNDHLGVWRDIRPDIKVRPKVGLYLSFINGSLVRKLAELGHNVRNFILGFKILGQVL